MHIRALLAVSASNLAALAQATVVVPNGADLAPYIAAAAPGDTLVLGASHPNFTLTKGLQLLGNGTQIVPAQYSPTTTIQVPAGQRAALSDLWFTTNASPPLAIWGSNLVIQGDVRFDACQCNAWTGAMTVIGGTVLIRNCQLTASFGGSPLTVSGGTCAVVGTTATGSDAYQTTLGSHNASPGIRQTGGSLWIAGCTVSGGAVGWIYGQPTLLGMPGFDCAGGNAWVVDSSITGGAGTSYMGSPVYGLPAIRAAGAVQYARCTLTAGASSPPVAPTTGNATLVPELVGMAATGQMTLGTTFQVGAVAGSSQQMLTIAVSLQAGASAHALAAQPVLGGGMGLLLETFAAAPVPGSQVTASRAIPVVPALRGTYVTWQAFQWTNGLVQASPLAGDVVR